MFSNIVVKMIISIEVMVIIMTEVIILVDLQQ